MSTTSLVLAPHGDDETLFAAYTCMRTRAHVIICTYDKDPVVRPQRTLEVFRAVHILGCTHHEWPVSEAELEYEAASARLVAWRSERMAVNHVYAPAVEPEGHEQHNLIGQLALDLFGSRVIPYLTYAPRGQRSRNGTEVVPTPDEIQRKLQALSQYSTQIENPATRPWFYQLLDLREWIVE